MHFFFIFLLFSNVDSRVVMLDETDEAPGVQGIGIPRLVFWVWQDGDGHSPNGMTRDPWFGTYWKVTPTPSSPPLHFLFLAREVGHARDRNRRRPLPRRSRLLNALCLIKQLERSFPPVQILPHQKFPFFSALKNQFFGELISPLFIGGI